MNVYLRAYMLRRGGFYNGAFLICDWTNMVLVMEQ
jgi:hypothetical protein